MPNHTTIISDIIKDRRSIYPQFYTEQKIDKSIIEELLLHANYAPTHRKTEPWRFRVITGEKLGVLGDLLAKFYEENTAPEKFQAKKKAKKALKPRQSSHLIAICMERDPKESIPEWEEVAATAIAVQNMMLLASSLQIGSYWSSYKAIESPACRDFLALKPSERCLGFLYLGYHQMPKIEAIRKPIESKTIWL